MGGYLFLSSGEMYMQEYTSLHAPSLSHKIETEKERERDIEIDKYQWFYYYNYIIIIIRLFQ